MAEYVHYKEARGPKIYKLGKYSFSTIEIRHLSFSLVMITATFMAFDINRVKIMGPLVFALVYLTTIGLGFLLHELGHKLTAQHYGYVSEFRADFILQIIIFLLALSGLGFIILAPGAVLIMGNLTRRENGIISVAGPLVNLALAAFFAIISIVFHPTGILYQIVSLGIWINAFLGIFNMLPIWILDGKKVLMWNWKVYIAVLLPLLGFLFAAWTGVF